MGERRLGVSAAVADALTRRFIDDNYGDIALRIALLLDKRRVGESCEQCDDRQHPPGETAGAPHQSEGDDSDRGSGERADCPPWQNRGKGQAIRPAVHWPKRSRMAGTCTWSDL